MNCEALKIELRVRLSFAVKGATPLRRYAVTRMLWVVSEQPCCKTFARSVCTTQTEPPFYKTFARRVCRVFAGSGDIEILSRSVDILVLARPGNFDVLNILRFVARSSLRLIQKTAV